MSPQSRRILNWIASQPPVVGETILRPHIPKRLTNLGKATMFFPTQTISGIHLNAVKAQMMANMYRLLDSMGLRDDSLHWNEKIENQYESVWQLKSHEGSTLATIHVTKPESTWENFQEGLNDWFKELESKLE